MLEAAAAAAAALLPAEVRQQLALCDVTIPAPLMLGTQVRSPHQPDQSSPASASGLLKDHVQRRAMRQHDSDADCTLPHMREFPLHPCMQLISFSPWLEPA